jgi:hypothetical protein
MKEQSTKVLTQNGFYRSRKFALLPDPLTDGMPSRLSLGLHNPNWHRTSSHVSNSDFISAVVAAVSHIPVSPLLCHVIIKLMVRNYRLL